MSVKSVYMMTDLEGVAGVDDWDPRHRDDATTAKGVYDRAEMQRLLTGEVNAAAEGLFAAGVEEIIINDAHGAGRTILSEELISGVKLVQGVKRPCWLPGLSPKFDALIQVGMHAMTGTPQRLPRPFDEQKYGLSRQWCRSRRDGNGGVFVWPSGHSLGLYSGRSARLHRIRALGPQHCHSPCKRRPRRIMRPAHGTNRRACPDQDARSRSHRGRPKNRTAHCKTSGGGGSNAP